MESDIFDTIEAALTRNGYKIMGEAEAPNDGSAIIIRHPNSDQDYRITVQEEPG